MLPTSSQKRKGIPIHTGFNAYFPLAIAEVARLSMVSNEKHNPGEPLHWSKHKSSDHADCLARHQLEWDQMDDDTFYHAVKVAWRAMAQLEILLEGLSARPDVPWDDCGPAADYLEDDSNWFIPRDPKQELASNLTIAEKSLADFKARKAEKEISSMLDRVNERLFGSEQPLDERLEKDEDAEPPRKKVGVYGSATGPAFEPWPEYTEAARHKAADDLFNTAFDNECMSEFEQLLQDRNEAVEALKNYFDGLTEEDK